MAKLKTRNNILSAAERLFSKDGYDGVPTKLIASEAGITEMTLFNHFPNKELLYKTVVKERYLSIEIGSVFSELSYINLEKDLIQISERLIGNFVENRNLLLMRLKEKQSFQNDESFRIETDPLLKQIIPVFDYYKKQGVIKGPSEGSALLFMSAFKGLCHIYLLDDKSEDEIIAIVRHFISTFCYGIISK